MASDGIHAPKRTKPQIIRDRALIARWTALGYELRQMEALLRPITQLNGYVINHVTIWRDQRAILQELKDQTLENAAKYRAEQTQQLMYVISEAAQAYEKSKEPHREQHAKRVTNCVEVRNQEMGAQRTASSIVGREEVSTRTTECIPSARHLEVIVKAAERMARLWGLDVRPEEQGTAGTGTPAPFPKATMPFEEANRLLFAALGRNVVGKDPEFVSGPLSSVPQRGD